MTEKLPACFQYLRIVRWPLYLKFYLISYLIYPGLIFVNSIINFKMGTDYLELISLKVFIVANGLLMGFALLMAAARIVIQFHSQRKLLPEDFVLMFACSTFIASQALLYFLKIEGLYWLRATAIMPMSTQNLASILEDPEAFYRRVVKLQRIENSSVALTWTSICAVKISFLLFFYQMVTRLRRLFLAWKVIFGVTIFFWATCMCALFISCPHINPTIKKCPHGRRLNRGLPVLIISTLLDITSDLLLISIPLFLLWKVKIQRQQKIFVGIFLCLSVCMIIIAIVRISGFIIKNNFDMVWLFFWHQVEGAVAIIMVSITAFRSILGIKALKAREKERIERSWFLHRPKLLARCFRKETKDTFPSVPGATLTGMRTFINGNEVWDESKEMKMTHKSGKNWIRAVSHELQEIEVAHISTRSNISDGAKSARAADFV